MENIENLVPETMGAENAETPAEESVEKVETPKTYTEEEFNQKFNEAVGKKLARQEAKIRKEYERKYGALENVLKAGTGKNSVEEMTDTFKKFYESKGISIPSEPTYSNEDIEVLAQNEANKIIGLGFEEAVEEADRLNELGANNMTDREKSVFVALTNYIKSAEQNKELSKIGVHEDVYNSKEFKDFASKFSSNTPITEVYEIYSKTLPKKDIKPMGSIKNTTIDTTTVKDFYTYEEAKKFTRADFDKNPKLFEAVEKSMHKW